jgi:hypothetical protein
VTDEKPPVEKAVELFVYAPVGLALYVRDMLPSMMGIFVNRGKREVQSFRAPPPPPPPIPDEVRRRLDESVGLARVVAEGGFGVARGVAGSGIGVARDVAGSALQGFLSLRNGESAEGAPGASADAPAADAGTSAPSETAAPAPSSAPTPTAPPDVSTKEPAPSAESLPIPDYDELSASQVVQRLDGLDASSLEAIRSYESEHRGRNTILGKIAKLT